MDDRPAPPTDPPLPDPPLPEAPLPEEALPTEAPPPPRQRWRLVVARSADAPASAQRESSDAWLAAIEAAGLPLARTAGATPRPRISFGAALPVGMAAEGELIDIVLTERWPAWRVREALEPLLPEGWRIVRPEDVWLGGPPLAGRVAAADYRIALDRAAASSAAASSAAASAAPSAAAPASSPADAFSPADALRAACARLLDARRLPRERTKGDRVVAYDLRPLLLDVRVGADGPPLELAVRTRFHSELGTGRPEEVVAALADAAGVSLTIASVVRERLLLADEVGDAGRP